MSTVEVSKLSWLSQDLRAPFPPDFGRSGIMAVGYNLWSGSNVSGERGGTTLKRQTST